jgi:hypothetical protein
MVAAAKDQKISTTTSREKFRKKILQVNTDCAKNMKKLLTISHWDVQFDKE